MIVSDDMNGRQYLKPFRLLSNTAETNLEMHAVQQDIVVPGANGPGNPEASPMPRQDRGIKPSELENDKQA